jgi:RNA polymerase sigma-70 factor (ECF subfamily)
VQVESFESYRPLLFGVAYRMLGSAMEAEDILQEAYLRYRETPTDTVRAPKAFLCKIVTRLCLDHLKSARVQRESYFGPWLPEPVLTDNSANMSEMETETLSMAFLVLIESLSPAERAVFLLHEVFDFNYGEIAEIVGKDESACRQILHRAKQHVAEHRPRYKSTPEAQQALLGKFMAAVAGGDLEGLMSMLAEDVTHWGDGGGKVAAAAHPVMGRHKVARLLAGIMRFVPENTITEVAMVNGQPGVVARVDGVVQAVILLDMGEHLIHGTRFVVNPDKLKLPTIQVIPDN